MKNLIFIFATTFLFACGSSEKKESSTEKKIEEVKSTEEDTVINETDVMVKVSAEDSTTFYEALKAESEMNDKFCKCAEKKGRTHKDCRLFQKTQNYADIETDILNKYYNTKHYDEAAVKRMNDAMNVEMEKFNACGK